MRRRDRRGYIMLVVMVVLMAMVVAGGYAFKALSSETSAAMKFRKSELLISAAEAGVDHRMSEVALCTDANAIMNDAQSTAYAAWNAWPSSTEGFISSDGNPSWTAPTNNLAYRTSAISLVWTGKNPPPGVPVGTNTYIFQLTSYAVQNDLYSEGGQASIDVGIKTWDQTPGSYSP